MDPFALLAVDPTPLPLWGVLLLAAGMYPVGMLFGCSRCCACICESGETLPNTVTVTLSGFTDQSQGPNLCTLAFESCYGSNAAGHVTEPFGDPDTDRGPVAAVVIDNPGVGYAKLGRSAPTLTASGVDGGSDAAFGVTIAQSLNACNVDEWKVTAITGTGGTGYYDTEGIIFALGAGDTEEQAATATIHTERSPPTLTATVVSNTGSGAELTITLAAEPGTPTRWKIASVTVDNGGQDYINDDTALISRIDRDIEVLPAELKIRAAYSEPTVEANVATASGTGASLAVTLAPATAWDGADVWTVSDIDIVAGGAGYDLYDNIEVTVTDGAPSGHPCLAYVSQVDGSGSIMAITLWFGGDYYKAGPIDEVLVPYGGLYYHDTGIVESVTVADGGIYYHEDDTLPPYVADVTVTIMQTLPSDGTGAALSATVDDDPTSATFGKITAITIDDAGDNYLAWQWLANSCCGHYLNNVPIVLARWIDSNAENAYGCKNDAQHQFSDGTNFKIVDKKCLYTTRFCGGWAYPFTSGNVWDQRQQRRDLQLLVGFAGEGQTAAAELKPSCSAPSVDNGEPGYACCRKWFSESPIASCSQFSWSASNPDGTSITVSQGGIYDPYWRYESCSVCCQGSDVPPDELTVVVEDLSQPVGGFSGTYVLARYGDRWIGELPDGTYLAITHSMIEPINWRSCAADECGTCIKKCVTGVVVGFNGAYMESRDLNPDGTMNAFAPICDRCEPTPTCRPAVGRQFLIHDMGGNPAVTALRITVQ